MGLVHGLCSASRRKADHSYYDENEWHSRRRRARNMVSRVRLIAFLGRGKYPTDVFLCYRIELALATGYCTQKTCSCRHLFHSAMIHRIAMIEWMPDSMNETPINPAEGDSKDQQPIVFVRRGRTRTHRERESCSTLSCSRKVDCITD